MTTVLLWVLSSLLAIGNVGDWEMAGLAIALLGGIGVGLSAVLAAEAERGCEPRPAKTRPRDAVGLPAWKRWGEGISRTIVRYELLWLVLAGPLYLFPRRLFVPVFVLLPLLWLLRRRVRGYLTVHTPLDWPIVFLLVMVLVSIPVSADLDRSLPKLAGILWGVAVFYAVVNGVNSELDALRATGMVVGVGVLIALAGLLGTKWMTQKFIPVQVVALLPRALNIPGTANGWIHPNEVGGSLAWIVPFLLSLTIGWTEFVAGRGLTVRLGRVWNWAVVGALVFTTAVLILTQSRSALFGVALAVVLFTAVRWPKARPALALLTVAAATAGWMLLGAAGGDLFADSASQEGGAMTLNWAARQEVWSRALYMIQDVPFTGVGLNMFDPVVKVLYPLFLMSPDASIFHAHDIYLQVAVDLGIPGLVAYVSLLTAFTYLVCKVYTTSAFTRSRTIALGLGLGMLAHQIFGLTDAITLGAKPGLLFWLMLALAAVLWRREREPARSDYNS